MFAKYANGTLFIDAWSSLQHLCHSQSHDSIIAAARCKSVFHRNPFALCHKQNVMHLAGSLLTHFCHKAKVTHSNIHAKTASISLSSKVSLDWLFVGSTVWKWMSILVLLLIFVDSFDLKSKCVLALHLHKINTSDGFIGSKWLLSFVQKVVHVLSEFDISPIFINQVVISATVEERWASTGNGRRNRSVL